MEKEGLIRAIKHIKDNKLTIKTLVTDRHTQVRKHMREKEPSIKHRTDGWHIGNGRVMTGQYLHGRGAQNSIYVSMDSTFPVWGLQKYFAFLPDIE